MEDRNKENYTRIVNDQYNHNMTSFNQEENYFNGAREYLGDIRRDLNLNKVNDTVGELAPMKLRRKAYFFDKLILLIPVAILFYICLVPNIQEVLKDVYVYETPTINLNNLIYKAIGFFVLYKIIFTIYYVVIPCILKGQTLGKKKYNIRIVNADPNIPNVRLEDLFKREMLWKIPECILFIGYLISYNKKDKIATHDKRSKTRVILEHKIVDSEISYDNDVSDVIEREE